MHPTGEIAIRRVVTATDFHESSWEAALWAMHHLAPDAEHDLLNVVEVPTLPGPLLGLGANREQLRLAALSRAQQRLDELAQLGASARSRTHLREGSPAAEVVRVADEVHADLIVVGEQGATRGVAALLGSTAGRVLYSASIPVLVAPEGGRFTTALAARGNRSVRGIGRRSGTGERHVRPLRRDGDRAHRGGPRPPRRRAERGTRGGFQRLEVEATASMQRWLDEMVQESALPPSAVQVEVLVGDPSYEIISQAARQGADLVRVGSKGGDIARTPLIGRIVNKVVRSAPCSVLVVVPRERTPT